MAGKPVTTKVTHPYGCWIRYKDNKPGYVLPIATPTARGNGS
jgi:hypothetical protein